MGGAFQNCVRLPTAGRLLARVSNKNIFLMSRRRIGTSVLEARGAFLKHPERRAARMNEPKPTGELGPPLTHMSAEHRTIWRELASTTPPGVLTNCDCWAFEILVCLMAKFRKGQTQVGELSQILNLLARMGLTPADRNRVAVTCNRLDLTLHALLSD
jgi:hypothetical protein